MHGRWKTDAAKDMHVEESLDKGVQVTKFQGFNLGSCSFMCLYYLSLPSFLYQLIT